MFDDDDFAYLLMFIGGLLIATALFFAAIGDDSAADQHKRTAHVCSVLGGTVIEDVCVKNDKVVYRP